MAAKNNADNIGQAIRNWASSVYPILAGLGWVLFIVTWQGSQLSANVSNQEHAIGEINRRLNRQDERDTTLQTGINDARAERFRQITDLTSQLAFLQGRIAALEKSCK